jgi:diguanylate cyclase (GGDEF)-like protein
MEAWESTLRELREHYVRGSGKRLEQLSFDLVRLSENPADLEALRALKRIFHGLSGSGTTYGFPRITALGQRGERICDQFLCTDQVPAPEHLIEWQELCRELVSEFEGIRAGIGSPVSETVDRPTKQLQIFVVDPDPNAFEILNRLMEREGLSARYFQTKVAAVAAVEQQMPDGLIIDIHLPDGSSYELVEWVRAVPGGDAPAVLMISPVAGFLDKVEVIRCGADGYFEKPLDWEALMRRLQHLLERMRKEPVRILSMEDDPDQASFISAALGSAGYEVRGCDNPKRFESELVSFRPDLVLMDILLPEISGYDLARYIRQDEKYATLPILFLTAQGEMEAKISSVKAGGDDYLVKPVSAGLLLSTVAARIERARFLRSLLDRDGLTRLLTHTAFLERAKVVVSQKDRDPSRSYAMAMIDLDRFKSINDSYGHLTGDRVLASLSALLRRRLRQADVIGRYGGEEFAVIIDDLQEEEAVRLMRRLLEEFSALEYRSSDGQLFHATFSAGISMVERGMGLEHWRLAADKMLYAAKAAGRNCILSALYQQEDTKVVG